MNLVTRWNLYFFYSIFVLLWYAGQRKTIVPMYRPEDGSYVHQGHALKTLVRSFPRLQPKRLTNPADMVESSKPQLLLLSFTQIRTRKVKAAQMKNNAVAELSQGPRLSDMFGRVVGSWVKQASNSPSDVEKDKAGWFLSKDGLLPTSGLSWCTE